MCVVYNCQLLLALQALDIDLASSFDKGVVHGMLSVAHCTANHTLFEPAMSSPLAKPPSN